MAKEIPIKLFDEEGNIKSKEQFINEMNEAYDSILEQIDEADSEQDCNCGAPPLMKILAPDGEFDPRNVLEKYQLIERKLYLDQEITEEMGREFLEKIQFWNSEDEFDKVAIEERIPIQIYINSPGGLISASLEIIDAIQNSTTPVHTVVTGTAYSGAFFISIAGHMRYAFPSATFLFHEGMCEIGGDAHKVLQQIAFYKKQLKRLKELVLEFTEIPEKTYKKHKKDDWLFDAKKALKLGVIDEISEDVNGGIYYEG